MASTTITLGTNIELTAADITHSGVVTTTAQSFAGVKSFTGSTAFTWAGGGVGSTNALTQIGDGGTGGSLLINTPSANTSFQSGLGIDGTYAYPDSVIKLHAVGVNSAGGYQSSMQILTTHDQGAYAEERIAATFGPDMSMTSFGGVILNTSVAKPAAAVAYRGALWVVQGDGGVADKLQVCLKSAADTYSWKDIVTG